MQNEMLCVTATGSFPDQEEAIFLLRFFSYIIMLLAPAFVFLPRSHFTIFVRYFSYRLRMIVTKY